MPIEIAALAATVVANYLLPYVKVGVEKIAEVATDKFSSVAADHVTKTTKKLWQKITGLFDSPDEKKTLERFEKDPERMAGSLEVILEEKLQQNEELARELQELVDAESPDGAGTGAQIMNATVAGIIDLRQAKVSGGSFTAVRVDGGVQAGAPGSQSGSTGRPDRAGEDE